MTEILDRIRTVEAELAQTASTLAALHTQHQRTVAEIAFKNARSQFLQDELRSLRAQIPTAQPSQSQPTWYDSEKSAIDRHTPLTWKEKQQCVT